MALYWKDILTIYLFSMFIPSQPLLSSIITAGKTAIRAHLNFTELVTFDGYKSESYKVVTKDGYKLTIFRIPPKKNCAVKLPIYFQHGHYLSGDDCVIPGPGVAHCYIYSDECYDVWIGNSRGTRYSRDHVSLNPDTDKEFWDFSFTEMGIYDVPAFIDHILKITKQEQLYYIGHSAAVAAVNIMAATNPDYNDKVKVGFGISPTAWIGNARLPMVTIQKFVATLGLSDNLEIFRHGGVVQTAAEVLCGLEVNYLLCSAITFSILGYDGFQMTKEVLPVVLGHSPAGVSLKDFTHWGQVANDGFREYDYKDQNMDKYGQKTPPEFALENVRMKIILIGSENDYLADLKDVRLLQSKLPNSELCVLKNKLFSHLAFVYGKDIPISITPTIINYIENNKLECL